MPMSRLIWTFFIANLLAPALLVAQEAEVEIVGLLLEESEETLPTTIHFVQEGEILDQEYFLVMVYEQSPVVDEDWLCIQVNAETIYKASLSDFDLGIVYELPIPDEVKANTPRGSLWSISLESAGEANSSLFIPEYFEPFFDSGFEAEPEQ